MHVLSNRAALLSIGFATLLIFNLGMAPHPPANVHLWELVGVPTYPDQARTVQQPWFIREQKILFERQTLESLRDLAHPISSRIVLNLIGETTHELLIQSRTAGPLASTVIQGHLQNTLQDDMTLILKDNVVAGTIHFNKRTFEIQFIGNGEHLLVELDPEKLPPD